MEYSKELPVPFKTWLQFLDRIRQNNLDRGLYEDVLVDTPLTEQRRKLRLPPEQLRFKICYVKEQALEEVLADRISVKEVMEFTTKLMIMNQRAKGNYDSPDYQKTEEEIKRVKRILLTQAVNVNYG